MSVYKPFITSDIVVSPFELNKSFSYEGAAALTGSGINRYIGENTTTPIYVSGSNPTGDTVTIDSYLVYRSIRELYYYNFISGSDGSPVTTASFNEDGTITGGPYTPNAYNYLQNTLPADRYFPTGSGNKVGVLSIPSNLYGEYIKPGSFRLAISGNNTINDYVDDNYIEDYFISLAASGAIVLADDGQGNVLLGALKVGDIIYSHGIIILTSDGIPGEDGYGFVTYGSTSYGDGDSDFITDLLTSPDISCFFKSTITVYESQYKCTIRENEFNFSQNPSLISGSSNSGVLYDYATGSYFAPYVTTVGMYNNKKELLAVAKLAQPLVVSPTTDTSIIINLDI
jgi:hypothetical protein